MGRSKILFSVCKSMIHLFVIPRLSCHLTETIFEMHRNAYRQQGGDNIIISVLYL